MPSLDRDPDRLELILLLISDIDRRLGKLSIDSFLVDRDERDLTSYRLATIGEEAFKLSDALKERHDLPWNEIYGLRNRVAHDYLGLNPRLIWNTARDGLAGLAAMCRIELDRLTE